MISVDLVKDNSSVILGVSLLKSISEEFVSNKEDAPMNRKKFLKDHLTTQLDTILGIEMNVN